MFLVTLEAYPGEGGGGTWHRRFVAVFIKYYKITRIKRTLICEMLHRNSQVARFNQSYHSFKQRLGLQDFLKSNEIVHQYLV